MLEYISSVFAGYTQLKVLSKDVIGELIQQSLPSDWLNVDCVTWTPGQNGHPSSDWLENIWVYLQQNFQRDLSSFERLPIIPVASKPGGAIDLVPLYSFSGIVMRTMDGLSVENGTEDILKNLGVTVIDELPLFIRAHPLVAELYIFSPSFVGILKALYRICEHTGMDLFAQQLDSLTSAVDKKCLRSLFCRMSPYDLQLRSELRELLQRLPLFETLIPDEYVSSMNVNMAAPAVGLPVSVSRPLIKVTTSESANLATLLGIRQLTVIELLREVIFPDVEDAYYDPDQVQTLMLYVLRHYYSFLEVDTSFVDTLQNLTFLPRRDMFMTAERFYDPTESLLQKLFIGEENFPSGAYADQSVLAVLKDIGLRGIETVEPEDLLETAMQIQDSIEVGSITVEEACSKSEALMEYLLRFPDKLQLQCDDKLLHECLAEVRWVRPQNKRPAFYPESLNWFEATQTFEVPNGMKTACYASVIGSVLPIVPVSRKSELGDIYGWNTSPGLEKIAAHMKYALNCYEPTQKAKYMDLADNVYTELCKYETNEILEAFHSQSVTDWIWHGEGFTTPDNIVFTNPFMDLRPLVFSIPREMERYNVFFELCGVKHECHLPDVLCMIKAKYESESLKYTEEETKRDMHLCVSILNELKSRLTESSDKTVLQEALVIPLLSDCKTLIQMAALNDCTYCDQEWLRQGYDLNDMIEGDEQIRFVHPNVPNTTSEALGVPTLMSRMLDAEELDFSFGQSDSLTHRLNVLLQEYTDGFAVPKELVSGRSSGLC